MSREKVIWNESTKKYVQELINRAGIEASQIVQDEMQETDVIDWMFKCRTVMNDAGSDTVLGKLSRIVDKDMLSPHFLGNKNLKFGQFNKVFGKNTDIKKIWIEKDWNTKKETVKREKLENWDSFVLVSSSDIFPIAAILSVSVPSCSDITYIVSPSCSCLIA